MRLDVTDRLVYLATKISNAKTYEQIKPLWENYFETTLTEMGFNSKSISHLLNWGQAGHNWNILHRENTQYKNHTKYQLISLFNMDVVYMSDRISLDRLFRAHWAYHQAFEKELLKDFKSLPVYAKKTR